ncbi:hypothetical protein [Streptomyces sp. NPDC102283]|uniref:hypothetical protein n=1 Tax=Streptomyces sp. NPDC102283 TaxID=3366155 RepID=UPI003829736A
MITSETTAISGAAKRNRRGVVRNTRKSRPYKLAPAGRANSRYSGRACPRRAKTVTGQPFDVSTNTVDGDPYDARRYVHLGQGAPMRKLVSVGFDYDKTLEDLLMGRPKKPDSPFGSQEAGDRLHASAWPDLEAMVGGDR